jgi:hypothetical protein
LKLFAWKSYIRTIDEKAISMQKRSKFTLFVAMPIVAALWFVGWTFFWAGSNRRKAQKSQKLLRGDLSFALVAAEDIVLDNVSVG